MTGLVRKATLLSLCGLLVAAVAFAGTPSGTFSTFPPNNCVKLVGRSGATAFDPGGTFTIIVRDGGGNLVPNSNVVLDFSSCPDVHMGDQASNLQFAGNAGLTENAAFKQVTRAAGPTNGLPAGQVSFTLLGGSTNGGGGLGLHFHVDGNTGGSDVSTGGIGGGSRYDSTSMLKVPGTLGNSYLGIAGCSSGTGGFGFPGFSNASREQAALKIGSLGKPGCLLNSSKYTGT